MKACTLLWTFIVGLAFFINPLNGAPAVTDLVPYFGPSSGGSSVTITGSGFTGVTAVNFGTEPATSFIFISDTTISATSPPHTPEVVGVTVTTGSGTSPVTNDSLYAFQGDGLAYVANTNSNNVTVIDTTSNTVIATVPVGSNPKAIALLPDGSKAYIANSFDNSVSVIETTTNMVTSTILVGALPVALAVTPDGTAAFVVNATDGTVKAIDTASDSVSATITVQSNPIGIAITPAGTKAYVTNSSGDSISVIDTVNNMVITNISVSPSGTNPTAIAIIPNGTRAFAVNNNSSNVTIVDAIDDVVMATPGVGSNPTAVAITPDGTKAYIANQGSMNVTVIDAQTNAVITTIGVATFPEAIAISPDGTKAYVVQNNNAGTVSVIATASNMVTAVPNVGSNPSAIAITPNGARAYVTNSTSSNVSVIDTSNNTVTTVAAGTAPEALAIAADQAPLAKFAFNSATSNVSFDASNSVSPLGTIANYFWDFGDGNTMNTSLPTTTHAYASSGNYTATLTVTNSAGTSTTQIFNPSSSNSLSFNNASLTHNGGPSAQLMQTFSVTVIITLLPPTHLRIKEVKDKFLDQTDLVNVLKWQIPSGGTPPTSYRIYRNAALTKLAGSVDADKKLEFFDHNRKKGHVYTYFVVSVDEFGNQSSPAMATIKDK